MAQHRLVKYYICLLTITIIFGCLYGLLQYQNLRTISRRKQNGLPRPVTNKVDLKETTTVVTQQHVFAPFHRQWQTNCSALNAGDKDTIKITTKIINQARKQGNGSIPVPTDKEVHNWTLDCSLYRRLRRYPTTPVSEEEAQYPLAYVIVTHKDAAQVERLLRAIYQPQHIICIHPDAKSPQEFHIAIKGLARCFENVFIPSKVETVTYAGISRLMADINCMRDLTGPRGVSHQWKYLMNLCGQDFPLKTNLEIIRQLKAYNGHNDINGIIPKPHILRRTKFQHFEKNGGIHRTGKLKTPAPHNIHVYFGNAYIAATRQFVEYVVHNPIGVDLLNWVNDTYSPDETFWVTLHRANGTPGGYPIGNWESNIRFLRWGDVPNSPRCVGKYVRALCVFGVGHLQHLAVQPHLFANKFHYNYDPVTLQCLEETLNNRTLHPLESDKLIKFPVNNFSWQNHTATQ